MAPTLAATGDSANPIALAIGVLAPYLGGIAIALTALHLQYHVQSSLRGLMKQYRRRGIAVEGRVLSCEAMTSSSSGSSSSARAAGTKSAAGTIGNAPSPAPSYLVEVMYERPEHRHHSNPRQQFRDAGDVAESMPTKTFVKQYALNSYKQKMERAVPSTCFACRRMLGRLVPSKLSTKFWITNRVAKLPWICWFWVG